MLDFIIKYWVQLLLTAITAFVTNAFNSTLKRLKAESREQQMLKTGMLAILHALLYDACISAIHNNFISLNQLDNIEHLYKGYHGLGGNGTGTELYTRAKTLPLNGHIHKEVPKNERDSQ